MIELTIGHVVIVLVPVIAAYIIYGCWVKDWSSVAVATVRMFVQLIAIGYALTAILDLDQPYWVLLVICGMSFGAGWIALRPIRKYLKSAVPVFLSVTVAGAINLTWILAFVIQPIPWFSPSVVIPISGMVMANAMNAVSLCAERYWSSIEQGRNAEEAAHMAITAAMIPQINSLLAVGLVSLPGMMTGQILSGVSPLIAVRYQIVIMAMVLSTAAFGSFIYLKCYQTGKYR